MSRLFYILESDPVVALDLEGIVNAAFPDSRVLRITSIGDIKNYSAAEDTTLFIRNMLLRQYDQSTLQELERAQIQVIVLGASIEVTFAACTVEMPFTTEMIVAAVTSASSGSPERPLSSPA